MVRCWVALSVLALGMPACAAPQIECRGNSTIVKTGRYTARFKGPSLVSFKHLSTGETLVDGGSAALPFVRLVEKGQAVTVRPDDTDEFGVEHEAGDRVRMSGVLRHGDAKIAVDVEVQALETELRLSGTARTEDNVEGVASIGLALGRTDHSTDVIVPHSGGLRFKSSDAAGSQAFEWPISWEAGMLLVQGQKGGLLVSCFDPFERFKNLRLDAASPGYRISLETENTAPFEGQKTVQSLTWVIRPYRGEWRVGARQYRDWLTRRFKPTTSEDPGWVKNIRAETHCGLDTRLLGAIVKAGVDPKQTLIYVPSWRTNQYDRNYPDYSPNDKLEPFVKKAHELGFHVMLHVNYFGCDPKMTDDYARFEKYQFRQKYNGGKQWWLWTRANPEIKFAYIDPASREWRDFFVGKMVELVRRTGVDALHLDQTLCIFNDKNGLIDGVNSARGNLLLHEQLKKALPKVALSGEGLDEVTMIHESFAQRHAYGIGFMNEQFDRAAINRKHPVSEYLFGGRTKPYIYLGTCNPSDEQLFTAWRDYYRVGGVLPGYSRPTLKELENPQGAGKQVLDEMRAFQRERLDPDMEGAWPSGVDFPYRSSSGKHFAYLDNGHGWTLSRTDSRFRPSENVSQTITGVSSVDLPGSVPGWICYDAKSIGKLDPESYYVYEKEPRDLSAFHLEPFSGDLSVSDFARTNGVTWAQFTGSKANTAPASVRVVWPAGTRYQIAPAYAELPESRGPTVSTVSVPAGEAVMAASFPRVSINGSVKLTDLTTHNQVVPRGSSLDETSSETVKPRSETIEGVTKKGFFAHPPTKGLRLLNYFLSAPQGSKVSFTSYIGLRDGSKSDGVRFAVWVNGREVWSRSLKPGTGWQAVEVQLMDHATAPFMLSLVTDSEENYYYDWAVWGEPSLVTADH